MVFDFGEGACATADGLVPPNGRWRPFTVPVAVEIDAVGVEAGGEGVGDDDVGGGDGADFIGGGEDAVGVGGGDDVEGDGFGNGRWVVGEIVDEFIGQDG